MHNEGTTRFVEKMGLYYEAYGVPRIGGKIIGLLLTAPGPVSAEEIAGILKVSRSSVSTNIRLLMLYGFAEVVPGRESRTDYFALAEDAWSNAIRARIEGFKNLKVIVEQGMQAVGKDGTATERLKEMSDWADAMVQGQAAALAKWENRKDT